MEVCGQHIHEPQLAHLHVPDSTRQMIAVKLSDGVTISTILDSVSNNLDEISCAALLCHQDVHNISHQYNIEGIKLHANDHRSVSLWVDSMGDQANNNPILVFKEQGHEQLIDVDYLSKDDLLIGIRTYFQRDMLKKFGTEAVCMDSTHGTTNTFDFFLITILILDDLGEGVPVCWIICNRENAAVIR